MNNMTHKQSYFLISVSNKENLELCKKFALAGFTNSINGVWTFSELQEGDFVSFLYAARAHNLYVIEKKEVIDNADGFPPWKSVTFRMSGKTYYFPFRLYLKPIRKFDEPLVRNEFAYVAENLLLRGGYRKTQFQADQTTLQNVSQMGIVYKEKIEPIAVPQYSTFIPKFTTNRKEILNPKIFLFQEIILQALIRQHLLEIENMKKFLDMININNLDAERLEVLSEKALPEGHIDILIKEAIPLGLSRKIIIEVKSGKASEKDFEQLKKYLNELEDECLKGVLIARDFSKKSAVKFSKVVPFSYALANFDSDNKSFDELKKEFKIQRFE